MTASTATIVAFASLLGGAVLGVVVDAFGARKLAVGLAAFGLIVGAVTWGANAGGTVTSTLWGVLHVGGPSSTVAALIAGLAAVAVLGGWKNHTAQEWGGSIAGLIAFGAAASIVVALSKDLTLLLIGLETVAAVGYALVSAGGQNGSREAAMKYFIQGAIATAFFVLGMGVLVAVFSPTGDIDALTAALSGDVTRSVALAGVVLVVAALAFKAGSVPFHSWAPDAYESAAPSSSAFLAAGPKVGAIGALAALGVAASAGPLNLPLTGVLTVLAVLSVLVGSVTALRQTSYTRMLGYAGIAQVGYALIAVAATRQPMVALFFIGSYAVASTGTFLSATAFRDIRPDWDGTIEGLTGIGKEAPLLAVSTSVLVISLAGIPPLLGFWSKFVVFASAFLASATAFEAGDNALGSLAAIAAVAGVLGSIVSLGYYGGVLRALYAPRTASQEAPQHLEQDAESPRPSRAATSAVALLALVVVAAGVVPLVGGLDALVRFLG
jgi:NADH-quinone oxidoreductase subunit N